MPRLTKTYSLNFYGGEPLLSFGLVKKIVSFLNSKNKELQKRPHYALTTNGSLFSKEIFRFLNEHKFSVILSFDGLAQEVNRKKGSLELLVDCIGQLLRYPKIRLEVNSVFNPGTVDCLSESIQFIIGLNVPSVHLALATIDPWDSFSLLKLKKEMIKLRKFLISNYFKKGNIPVDNFSEPPKKGVYFCAAGKDRLSVTPEGEIWGCYVFPEYFHEKEKTPEYRKFYFGHLNQFIKNHQSIYPRVRANYARLSMDNYSTSRMDCFLCPDLEGCCVCPVNAAFSGVSLGKIPDYICEVQRIKNSEIRKFKRQIRLKSLKGIFK